MSPPDSIDPLTQSYQHSLSLLLSPLPFFASASTSSSHLPQIFSDITHCAYCQTKLIGGLNASYRSVRKGRVEVRCEACGKTIKRRVKGVDAGNAAAMGDGKKAFESVKKRRRRTSVAAANERETVPAKRLKTPILAAVIQTADTPALSSPPPTLPLPATHTSAPTIAPAPAPPPSPSLPPPPTPAAPAQPPPPPSKSDATSLRKKKRPKSHATSLAAMLEAKKAEREAEKGGEGGGLKDFLQLI